MIQVDWLAYLADGLVGPATGVLLSEACGVFFSKEKPANSLDISPQKKLALWK